MRIEASDINENCIELEPRLLLCINCKRGGGDGLEGDKVKEALKRIEENPELHIKLTGAFDEIGARTELFYNQTPVERRKDLDVLQRLGLCYGDTRSARDLFYQITQEIKTLYGICIYADNEYGAWEECPLSRKEYYKKGSKALGQAQPVDEMQKAKAESCSALEKADHIVIRAHHLLCIVCYIGNEKNDIPLAEDNLYEAWVKMRNDPDIMVTMVEGPGECCICPPCHSYVTNRGICVAACHLRDRKKDLDTCLALGITPGMTLSARELYKRIYDRIPHVSTICAYDKTTSYEWQGCGTVHTGRYETGLEKGVLK